MSLDTLGLVESRTVAAGIFLADLMVKAAEDALGVVECKTVSAGVIAADQALKKADVQLAKLVIGQSISGKSYFILNGDIAEVTEAVAAPRDALDRYLLETVIIPAPDEAVIAALMNKIR